MAPLAFADHRRNRSGWRADEGRRFASADDALRSLALFGASELGSLRLAGLVEAVRSRSMS